MVLYGVRALHPDPVMMWRKVLPSLLLQHWHHLSSKRRELVNEV